MKFAYCSLYIANAYCSLHIAVCILQFAYCSSHFQSAYCSLLEFEFESETQCGIESETESGTQYQICVESRSKNPIFECETESGSLHITVCILQFAHCSLHIAVCSLQ